MFNDVVPSGRVENGDHAVYNALSQLANNSPQFRFNKFLASGRAVAEAMELAASIDTFLESHASNDEFVTLGSDGKAEAAVDVTGGVAIPAGWVIAVNYWRNYKSQLPMLRGYTPKVVLISARCHLCYL